MCLIYLFCLISICLMSANADETPLTPIEDLQKLDVIFEADLGEEGANESSKHDKNGDVKTIKVERSNDFPSSQIVNSIRFPRLVWRKNAQILEVGGRFPATPPAFNPQKKHSKKQAIETNSPTAKEILMERFADKLTQNAKKFLKNPNSTLIAIRLESLK